jgi:hypothetical protein
MQVECPLFKILGTRSISDFEGFFLFRLSNFTGGAALL